MAYVKPGIEVTQVQGTSSPILTEPTLNATVVGKAYYIQDLSEDSSVWTTTYSGVSATINISDFGNGYTDIQNGDGNLVHIDIQSTTGANVGQVLHLKPTDHFSISESSTATITVSGSLSVGGAAITAGTVRVGYRAKKADSEGFKQLNSLETIKTELGEPVSWNPLAFAANLCQANSASVVTSYGADDPDGTDTLANLGLHDTYALAFIDDDIKKQGTILQLLI